MRIFSMPRFISTIFDNFRQFSMQLDAFDKFDSCENMTNMQKICVLRESGGSG